MNPNVRIPIIDADTHLTETPDLWTKRLPLKFREHGPRVDKHPESGLMRWRLGDRWTSGEASFSRIAGYQDEITFPNTWSDVDPACWDANQRAKWMDRNGIAAQVVYPNFVAFEGHALMALKDKELQTAILQTYNDYLVEWASPQAGRFILLASVPFWDREASIAEMRRCKELGFRGVIWAATLDRHGLPTFYDAYWDPFYAAAQEMGMSINFHVGVGYTADDADTAVGGAGNAVDVGDVTYRTSIGFQSNARTIAKLILFGVCHRFPNLPFVSVESGFGFIPYVVEAMDWQWRHVEGPAARPDWLLPSEYFRRQIYTMFWFEQGTLAQLPDYADNVMFETDFPHNTCLIPDSRLSPDPLEIANGHIDRFGDEIMTKVLYGNAAKVYGFDPANLLKVPANA
jgi:predicted TIM-barrel fold metal-dependent hydrolase